jgi:hypothetical protein
MADNLCRWRRSGQPRRWVEAHQGRWDHADWLALTESLRRSSFWPLDFDAVGEVLEGLRPERQNLRRWLESGQAQAWVEARQGHWSHADWLALLEDLKGEGFWPLEPAAVGEALSGLRLEWWNLRRWQGSGLARRWVQSRQGRWGHPEWLSLVGALERSEFWPLDLSALGRLLEDLRPAQALAA